MSKLTSGDIGDLAKPTVDDLKCSQKWRKINTRHLDEIRTDGDVYACTDDNNRGRIEKVCYGLGQSYSSSGMTNHGISYYRRISKPVMDMNLLNNLTGDPPPFLPNKKTRGEVLCEVVRGSCWSHLLTSERENYQNLAEKVLKGFKDNGII